MTPPELSKQDIAALVTAFSHDVSSPLTGVLALSDVLLQEGGVSERAREDLQRIHAAAEEIALMVRTLAERVAPSRAADR